MCYKALLQSKNNQNNSKISLNWISIYRNNVRDNDKNSSTQHIFRHYPFQWIFWEWSATRSRQKETKVTYSGVGSVRGRCMAVSCIIAQYNESHCIFIIQKKFLVCTKITNFDYPKWFSLSLLRWREVQLFYFLAGHFTIQFSQKWIRYNYLN